MIYDNINNIVLPWNKFYFIDIIINSNNDFKEFIDYIVFGIDNFIERIPYPEYNINNKDIFN